LQAINDPETGRAAYWEPQYMYDSSSHLINKTTTGCVPESGAMPRTTAAGAAMYNNPDYTFGGVHVPCINNTQVSHCLHFLSAFGFSYGRF